MTTLTVRAHLRAVVGAALRRDAVRPHRRSSSRSQPRWSTRDHDTLRRSPDVRAMATGGNNMDDARRRANARAARALPIKLVMVSKGGGKAMDSACKEWSDKLSRYAPFAEIVVKTNPKNAKDPKAQMEAEGERVMKHIDARDYVVLMDERGKDITSGGVGETSRGRRRRGTRGHRLRRGGGPFGHGSGRREPRGRQSAPQLHGHESPGGAHSPPRATLPRVDHLERRTVPSLRGTERGSGSEQSAGRGRNRARVGVGTERVRVAPFARVFCRGRDG